MLGSSVDIKGIDGSIATLREIKGVEADQDFFELHPQLKSIWSARVLESAREGFMELGRCPGGRFAIEVQGQVVGMTGFYAVPESPRFLRLRWHGLVPEARGLGLSGPAMRAVCALGKARFPKAELLVESMPAGDRGAKVARHFETLGFSPRGAPQNGGAIGFDWQEWTTPIENFLSPQELTRPRARQKP